MARSYPQNRKIRQVGSIGDGVLQCAFPFCSEIIAQAGKNETMFGKKNLQVLTAILLDAGISIGTIVMLWNMTVNIVIPAAVKMRYHLTAGVLNEAFQRCEMAGKTKVYMIFFKN